MRARGTRGFALAAALAAALAVFGCGGGGSASPPPSSSSPSSRSHHNHELAASGTDGTVLYRSATSLRRNAPVRLEYCDGGLAIGVGFE